MSKDINLTEGAITEVLNDKVDIDFQNVPSNSVGFARCSTEVTNCSTEIPQNIKLDLTDGVLTLKAGSKVIFPNGFEEDGTTPKFDEILIENDISRTWNSGAYTLSVFFRIGSDGTYSLTSYSQSPSGSGSTAPTTNSNFYNTSTNTVYRYNGGTKSEQMSFPLAIVTSDANGYVSIDKTFNGMGYIGSTIWIDKGVKGLIPNGRNEDGSLKNIEFTTSTVLTYQVSANANNTPIRLDGNTIGGGVLYYDNEKNINYITTSGVNSKRLFALVGTVSADSNRLITSLNPKTSFRAVDYNDFDTLNKNALLDSDKSTITTWGFPSTKYTNFTLGSSGATYTAPADGWFCVHLTSTVNGGAYAGFFRNNVLIDHTQTQLTNQGLCLESPYSKGDVLKISYENAKTNTFRFYYAKGAQ